MPPRATHRALPTPCASPPLGALLILLLCHTRRYHLHPAFFGCCPSTGVGACKPAQVRSLGGLFLGPERSLFAQAVERIAIRDGAAPTRA